MNLRRMRVRYFGRRLYDLRGLEPNALLTVRLVRLAVFVLLGLFFASIIVNAVDLALVIGGGAGYDAPGYVFIIAGAVAVGAWGWTFARDRIGWDAEPLRSNAGGAAEIGKIIVDDTGFYYYKYETTRLAARLKASAGFARKLHFLPRLVYAVYLILILAYPAYLWFVLNRLAGGGLPDLPDWLYLICAVALIVLYAMFFFAALTTRLPPRAAD